MGARTLSLPCIRCEYLESDEVKRELREALRGAHWVLFGSRRGAEALARLVDPGALDGVLIGAVGPRSGERSRELLGRIDLVAAAGSARALGSELGRLLEADPRSAAPTRVVFAGGDRASSDVRSCLPPASVDFQRLVLYRTLPAEARDSKVRLTELGVDTVFLASPSALAGLLAQAELSPALKIISIGPTTTAAMRARGLEPAGEARTRDLEGLVEALR